MDLFLEAKPLVRSLFRSRGYSAASIITLAAGVSANVIIFLLLNAAYFRPLSFPDDKLALLWSVPEGNKAQSKIKSVSYPDFQDWQQRGSSFSEMAAYNISDADLSDGQIPENVAGAVASPNFFSVLAVNPVIGAGFAGVHQGDHVVVLGYDLWQRRYQGDKGLIGKTILLSSNPYTVVGVLPAGFEHPEPSNDRQAEFWVPMPASASSIPRNYRMFRVIARLRDGISLKQSQAEMFRVGGQLQQEYPQDDSGLTVGVISLREQLFGEFRNPLLLLFGGALIVLAIACINITNLQLARTLSRGRDLLIRNALGAPKSRIVFWTVTESCLLSSAGAILGLLIAFAASRLFLRFDQQFVLFRHATVDFRVVLFTLAIVLVIGFITAVIPAIRLSSLKLRGLVSLNTRDTQSSRPLWRILRGALAVAQVSLVLPLLIVSLLLAHSFFKLVHVDPGFKAKNLLTFRLTLPSKRYPDINQKRRFYSELTSALRSMPGVDAASLSSGVPLTSVNTHLSRAFALEWQSNQMRTEGSALYRVVDDHYLDTLGIPLITGRTFSASDGLTDEQVAMVNATFAKTYWDGANPIGKRVHLNGLATGNGWLTVVGVVGDVHYDDLTNSPLPDLYVPFNEDPWNEAAVIVKSEIPTAALVSPVREAVQKLDPLLALSDVQTMDDIIFNATSRSRFALMAVAASSCLAFVLALAGVGAVVSYLVADRSHEFSVRIALGAQTGDIMRIVLGYGLKLGMIGLAAGVGVTLIIVPLLSHFVFGIQSIDTMSFTLACVVLLLSVLIACYFPGRRAASFEPSACLRLE